MERIGEDIAIELADELCVGSVVGVHVVVPGGRMLPFADIETYYGRDLVIGGLHRQSEGLQPNDLGWGRLRRWWRRRPMSMLSLLKERFGPPVRILEGSRVTSGSPARYHLSAERPVEKTISAMWALAKRHVPIELAKRQIEAIMLGGDITIDVPMVEDSAAFEGELGELG
ncbi:MAG TPA: hypothetical protein VMF86_18990, partial [Stellaceae bacterium]|nr:hypothetical protein [Stellaceae bacterium]